MQLSTFFAKVINKVSHEVYPIYRWHQRNIGFKPPKVDPDQSYFYNNQNQVLDLNKILTELTEHGVVVIENYFNTAWLNQVAEKADHCAKQMRANLPTTSTIFEKKFGYDQALLKEGILRLYHIDQEIAEVKAYQTDPLIWFLAEQYYQRKVRLETTVMQHNQYSVHGTRSWHIDSWVNQIKSFVYLTDVGAHNGPFTYLLGSHKNNDSLLKKTFRCMRGEDSTSVSEEEVLASKLTIKSFQAKKGTLILADTKGIHRGDNVDQGYERNVLVNYFYA